MTPNQDVCYFWKQENIETSKQNKSNKWKLIDIIIFLGSSIRCVLEMSIFKLVSSILTQLGKLEVAISAQIWNASGLICLTLRGMTVKSEHNFQKVSLLETGTKSLNSPNPTCLILALPISHKKAILVELYKLLFLLYYYYKQYIYTKYISIIYSHLGRQKINTINFCMDRRWHHVH